MGECICNSCKNLKGIIDESGAVEEFECEFGFPSGECAECAQEECDLTCGNYLCEDGQEEPETSQCKGCGKVLRQVCSGAEEGDVYCFDCYMKGL